MKRCIRKNHCRPQVGALEDRCVPALVPPSLILPSFQEFAIPTAGSGPSAITAGPEGNLWFTEGKANQIGRITPAGTVTEFPLAGHSGPAEITAGPAGNLWFTGKGGSRIGRITPAGTMPEFLLPPEGPQPGGITGGPDGNLSFTQWHG